MTRPHCEVCGNYQDQPDSWHWKGCPEAPYVPGSYSSGTHTYDPVKWGGKFQPTDQMPGWI